MNSESTNMDAINSSTHTNAAYSTDNNNMNNTENKTDTFNHAADNKRENLRQGVSPPAQTLNTNTDSVDRDSTPRESERRGVEDRDVESRDVDNRDTQNRDNTNQTNKDSVPKKGVAGVIASNFGADKTTTSTFEKSQGENYGEKFDETGAKLKGRFSVDESNTQASGSGAVGGGQYTMGGKQGGKAGKDTNVPSEHSSHSGSQKAGFGHKIMDRAEGIMHRHHHDKTESRTDVQ